MSTVTPSRSAPRPLRLPAWTLPAGEMPWLPGIPMPIGPLPGRKETPALGRIGTLETRLARTVGEVAKAQNLRYRIFYEEMSAIADAMTLFTRRDADAFDAICDHMLVLDTAEARPGLGGRKPAIVGTYRLLRQSVAERHDGFYSASEYDLAPLMARHPGVRFLELGRSCVLKPYRSKRTVELLWAGVWRYILDHDMDVLIGCASLEGTDPARLAPQLSFLHHHARAPETWRARALPERYVDMNLIPKDQLDAKAALAALPPLLKGYLRLGAYVGDGAVVDHQFGTTDVFLILPRAAISSRYIAYYGADASRHLA
jgi:L-ornithine Nalpha-acyltransferase